MKALHVSASALAIVGGATAAIAGTVLLAPHASAAPHGVDAYAYEETVSWSDVKGMGVMYACGQEDGSDIIPALADRCLWVNDGVTWLTMEDRSYRVVATN